MVRFNRNWLPTYGYVTPSPMAPDAKKVFGWCGKQTGDAIDIIGDGPAEFIGWYTKLRPYNSELVDVEQVEPFYGGCAYTKVFGYIEGTAESRNQIGWLVA